MQEAYETEDYRGYRIEYHVDEDGPNPRKEFDEFGRMVCWHGRYDLGDEMPGGDPGEWYSENVGPRDVVLPLYLYDHSGISMSTGRGYPYNDMWDAGQVGWIVASADAIRKEYSVKRISKQLRERVEALLRSEVAEYDAYLTGDVWGYVIRGPIPDVAGEDDDETDLDNMDQLDSCWGFFGLDYCKEEARRMVDYYADKATAAA